MLCVFSPAQFVALKVACNCTITTTTSKPLWLQDRQELNMCNFPEVLILQVIVLPHAHVVEMTLCSHEPFFCWGYEFLFTRQVNQRENLRRAEGLRLLKRPSALLPPHAVLEHVLGSLRTPDFPTDGWGLQQASRPRGLYQHLFCALHCALGGSTLSVWRLSEWINHAAQHHKYRMSLEIVVLCRV